MSTAADETLIPPSPSEIDEIVVKTEAMDDSPSPRSSGSSVIISRFTKNTNVRVHRSKKQIIVPDSFVSDDDDDDDDDQLTGDSPRHELNGLNQTDEPLSDGTWIYQADETNAEPTKKRKSLHTFEKDPVARKRQCNRLYKRLKSILDELNTRVGQQVVVILAQPPTSKVTSIKTYGSTPLQHVVTRYHPTIIQSLSKALARKEPSRVEDPTLFELPPLIIDGVATPIHKMTQAQLREFIPLMLRYSTGRGKPGWGHDATRPCWWPDDIPWANVRVDPREPDEKNKETWSAALRRIISACYEHHGRLDLLEDDATWSASNNITNKEDNDDHDQFRNFTTGDLFGQKKSDKRQVVLTDSEGREYCVEIAVSENSIGGHSLFGNLPFVEADCSSNLMLADDGRVVGILSESAQPQT